MQNIDPHTSNESLYECIDCGERTNDVSDGRLCDCGGYLVNISIARGE